MGGAAPKTQAIKKKVFLTGSQMRKVKSKEDNSREKGKASHGKPFQKSKARPQAFNAPLTIKEPSQSAPTNTKSLGKLPIFTLNYLPHESLILGSPVQNIQIHPSLPQGSEENQIGRQEPKPPDSKMDQSENLGSKEVLQRDIVQENKSDMDLM